MIINGLTRALVAVLWISFFIGSCAHKMIGVETLHTVQLIFIVQALSQHYLPVLTYFDILNDSLNAYQRIITRSAIENLDNYYPRLKYSANFIENVSVVAIL